MTMYAKVFGLPGGVLETRIEYLSAALEVRGIAQAGTARRRSLRAELQGLPTFAELVGPMWDGGGVRYETTAVNEEQSR